MRKNAFFGAAALVGVSLLGAGAPAFRRLGRQN